SNEHERLPIIVLTAFGEIGDAVQAMKQGALDYLRKPIDLDELQLAVDQALQNVRLKHQLDFSRKRDSRALEGAQMLGDSDAIAKVRTQIERLARLSENASGPPPTILILGETGAGKDVAARLLHASGKLRNRPFVQIDCASLPKDLIEAELFGHEKGAYTGAGIARTGLIEAAEDGTLFLDEIGELHLELQAKLLNVIERRKTRRLGATRESHVAAHFVAGTNRNLPEMIAAGRFRSDLYYRLNVVTLTLPPLRARSGHGVVGTSFFRPDLPALWLAGGSIHYRCARGITTLPLARQRARTQTSGGAGIAVEPRQRNQRVGFGPAGFG
ncbi:MAG: sigma 54-interacting transcriptional regulator, partial [Pseudomonadota bacterium]|nr:sigma 54-interacting transcriptional regulator [Pseudomonadota bacterium]